MIPASLLLPRSYTLNPLGFRVHFQQIAYAKDLLEWHRLFLRNGGIKDMTMLAKSGTPFAFLRRGP
jgi:hypothetical protein